MENKRLNHAMSIILAFDDLHFIIIKDTRAAVIPALEHYFTEQTHNHHSEGKKILHLHIFLTSDLEFILLRCLNLTLL